MCARSGCGTKLSGFIVFFGNYHCLTNDYVSVLSEHCTLPHPPRLTSSEKEFHLFRRNRDRGSKDPLIQNTCISVSDYLVSARFEQEAYATHISSVGDIQHTKIWTPFWEVQATHILVNVYMILFVLEIDPLWKLFFLSSSHCGANHLRKVLQNNAWWISLLTLSHCRPLLLPTRY